MRMHIPANPPPVSPPPALTPEEALAQAIKDFRPAYDDIPGLAARCGFMVSPGPDLGSEGRPWRAYRSHAISRGGRATLWRRAAPGGTMPPWIITAGSKTYDAWPAEDEDPIARGAVFVALAAAGVAMLLAVIYFFGVMGGRW